MVRRCGLAWLLALAMITHDHAVLADEATHQRLSQELVHQIEIWQAQVRQGDADAMFNLGQLFRRGIGIDADIQQARLFYEQAALLGHSGAQLNLGTLYYFGPDNPNIEKALYWWQQAARQGESQAQYQLALLYLNLPEPDLLGALAWMTLAQKSGDANAAQALPLIRARVPESLAARLPERLAEIEGAEEQPVRYRVQLASLSEEAAALRLMQKLKAEMPSLLEAVPFHVRAANIAGKNMYRLQAGAFISRVDADRLCDGMKAAGYGCFVVEN